MRQANPWIWLRDTLTKLPTTQAYQITSLLPRNAAIIPPADSHGNGRRRTDTKFLQELVK